MDTPDWMNSVNLAFSPKKIDMLCKKKLKKNVFHRTDGRTDTRSTQNYSSEPHKKIFKFMLILC